MRTGKPYTRRPEAGIEPTTLEVQVTVLTTSQHAQIYIAFNHIMIDDVSVHEG